ncbi:serine hydrolase domain-containing protein [Variovorax sp. M-6]|uniref:serine hydrolase domain-containing protein n=1 Tax=Variovorax sp. M-6 TaxID=3233041 RepID=UPI003F963C41
MTSAPTDSSTLSSAVSSPLLSRRQCLSLATAGLAAPLLQACGGGGSGSPALLPITWPAQSEPESVRWCRDVIRTALDRSDSKTTAVSVALLADDRVVWREAFGYAKRETGLLATPDTRFNIASVSKVITALVAMILLDRGQLTLDQPLVELLPAFSMLSPGYTRITVRHLLSHASGVPGSNEHNLFNFSPSPGFAQDTVEMLARSHLKHEPGELSVYCNDGFTLIEPLVHQLTGISFPEFVQREIFGPLGMSLSGYATASAAEGTFVHPYEAGHSLRQEMPANYASGGAITTPTDMMKLARLLIDQGVYEGRRIVSADAVREMGMNQDLRTLINPTPISAHRGLGWDSVQQPGMAAAGLRCWQKNGGTLLFYTEFFVLPEARLALLISGNGFDYGGVMLAEGVLQRMAVERSAIGTLPRAIESSVPPAAPSVPERAALIGVYATFSAPYQVVAENDGSLTLNLWDEDLAKWAPLQLKLRARGDGAWWVDGQPANCYRFATVDGHRYLIQRALSADRTHWAEGTLGEWLPPIGVSLSPAWRARVGSQWRLDNESPDSVLMRNGPIVFRIDELVDLPGYVFWNNGQLLRVVDDNTAGMTIKVPGNNGRDLHELVVEQGGDSERLHVGSLEFRRITA